MSTLPRDSGDTLNSTSHAPVVSSSPGHAQDFDDAIREFTSMLDELGMGHPSDDELRDFCRRVAKVSVDLFPGKLIVKVRPDPEIRGEVFFIFNVRASGNPDEIAGRIWQWHINLRQAIGKGAELFCLSFDVP